MNRRRIIFALGVLAVFLFWVSSERPATFDAAEKRNSLLSVRPLSNHAALQFSKKPVARALPVKAADSSARYKNSSILATRETSPRPGTRLRVELLRTQMKYPFLRIETRMESAGISRKERAVVVDEIAADHVMVQLQPGKTKKDLIEAIRLVGGKILRELRLEEATYLVALPEATLETVPDAITALSPLTNLLHTVEGDRVSHAAAIPNDPRFGEQWNLRNSGQTGGTPGADIDAAGAWDIYHGGTAAVVGISDTGIDYNHPDLRDNLWINPGEIPNNGIDDDGNGYVDDVYGWDFYDFDSKPYDSDGHGTFVAGIIGARGNNGTGIAGVCWNCRLMALRTLGPDGGFSSDIAEAFDYARHAGVKVINASHSGGGGDVLQSAVSDLERAGILLAAAAGNAEPGDNIDSEPTYPACYANKNILSVGASSDRDELSDYSNYGLRNVDLVAPGDNILSTRPNNRYDTGSGTSFATPQVTGACALIKSYHPEWSYLDIRNAILNNVDALPALAGRCASGGRLNVRKIFYGTLSLPTALDTTLFTWTTGGSAAWFGETSLTDDGVDAAESGEIRNSQESWLQTTVNGPGDFRFQWRVASEYQRDFFQFHLDGQSRSAISGIQDWSEQYYSLPAGTHVLRWSYSKNATGTSGQDRAWLDEVRFVGVPPGDVVIGPVNSEIAPGSRLVFSVTASGTPPFHFQWQKNGLNITGATASTFAIASAKAADSGSYTVSVGNLWGTKISHQAVLNVCTYAMSPAQKTFGLDGGTGSIAVTTTCPWTAATSNSWITLAAASGDGDGVISYSVAPNATNATRVGRILLPGATCLVTQYPELAPASGAGKTFSLSITNRGTPRFSRDDNFQLVLSPVTNIYWSLHPWPGDNRSGSYMFSSTSSSNANLSLETSQFHLLFTSPAEGTFSVTNDSGGSAEGLFNMAASRADMDFDGQADLLFQHHNGQLAAWFMQGTNLSGSRLLRGGLSAGPDWRAVGLADFNNDHQPDVVFQHTDGRLAAWLMNGTNFLRGAFLRGGLSAGAAWRAVGLADFNNDAQADILFQNTDGRLAIWFMQQTNLAGSQLLRDGAAVKGWWPVGVADFNGDGQNDLLWQNAAGVTAIWFMAGTEFISATALRNGAAAGVAWRIVGVADFNGDGLYDFLWQNNDGRQAVWLMNGTNLTSSFLLRHGAPVSPGWHVIGPK